MKRITIILSATVACLLAGCASTPVVLSPVGPNPFALAGSDANGQLEVFSATEGRIEGDNPTWFQHGDYYIYTQQGRMLKRVVNTVGYYEEAPCRLSLSPGNYLVKAGAKDYFRVEIPVVVRRGLLTAVHLDNKWKPPEATAKTNLVYTPDGYPIGWRLKRTYENR
jgi:hypothetical protein